MGEDKKETVSQRLLRISQNLDETLPWDGADHDAAFLWALSIARELPNPPATEA